MRFVKIVSTVGLSFILFAALTTPASATLISGWGSEPGNNNGTVTEGVAGSFSTTTPTGNLTPRALLPSTLTLTNVGDQIVLSGQVAMAAGINGNDSFRFWLVNSNGNTTGTLTSGFWNGAVITGWLGYGAEVGNLVNGNGNYQIVGRTNPNTGGWFSGTGAYNLSSPVTGGPFTPAATYNFNLTLTLASATSINVAYSFADTGGIYSNASSFTDPGNAGGGNVSTKSFNAVGFLENTSSGGAASFSNVDVTFVPVPEPSALLLLCCGGLAIGAARRISRLGTAKK